MRVIIASQAHFSSIEDVQMHSHPFLDRSLPLRAVSGSVRRTTRGLAAGKQVRSSDVPHQGAPTGRAAGAARGSVRANLARRQGTYIYYRIETGAMRSLAWDQYTSTGIAGTNLSVRVTYKWLVRQTDM